MKKKLILIIVIIVASVLVISVALSCAARFVFLSPSCYSDNDNLTEQENYFIKKTVLEAVEDRLSVFRDNGTHLFIWINTDFMESVTKENNEYIIRVQTHYVESASDDCLYEIHMLEDFSITFFGLDP
jgi:hypothetical protein